MQSEVLTVAACRVEEDAPGIGRFGLMFKSETARNYPAPEVMIDNNQK
jgi:hypothetical protein